MLTSTSVRQAAGISPERGAQDRDVIRRGERPGVTRAQHHREAVADVGTPRGQRMKPEALLVCPRRLGLGTGSLDQRGVQPDHQHRTRLLTGLGSGPGQVLPGDLHRRQLSVPGHDARPRPRPHTRGGTGQPPPRQAIGAQPPGQLVEDPQHRGVARPHLRDRRSPPGRSSPRCHSDTSLPRPASTPRPPTPDPDDATGRTRPWPPPPPARCTTRADQPAAAAAPPRPGPPSQPRRPQPTTCPTRPTRDPPPCGGSL